MRLTPACLASLFALAAISFGSLAPAQSQSLKERECNELKREREKWRRRSYGAIDKAAEYSPSESGRCMYVCQAALYEQKLAVWSEEYTSCAIELFADHPKSSELEDSFISMDDTINEYAENVKYQAAQSCGCRVTRN